MLLIVEVILRFFYADYLYTGSAARSLYYSTPNLQLTDENKTVHYAPNNEIRSITVYYNQVEYDTHHHSNNLGFLSDANYNKENKPGIAFVGDSFTAGVGSTTPYIPKLNKKYPDTNLYSFGVTGTGTWNFYHTFESFKDVLNFDTVVIMSISDDLRRHQWIPAERDKALYFYNKKRKRAQKIAQIIDRNIDASTLLKPEDIYIVKAAKLLRQKYDNFIAKKYKKKPKKSILLTNLNYDMTYIKKIKTLADKLGKRVIFVHIPEKGETIAGYYRCKIKDDIEKLGIEYHPLLLTHHFNKSMYHVHDGHPNNKGYAYLSSIIEEILHLKK